jgi:hypothetical protein
MLIRRNGKPYGAIRDLPKEQFALIVKSSKSMAQLLTSVGLVNATTNAYTARKRIAADGLDATHFTKRGYAGVPRSESHRLNLRASKLGVPRKNIYDAGVAGLTWCTNHKAFLPSSDFNFGRASCRQCEMERTFCRLHQLPLGWYKNKLAEQGGRCYLCRRTPEEASPKRPVLFLDHNHKCCSREKSCPKCARALLCNRCNIFVGWIERNPELLPLITGYIGKFQLAG